MAAPKGKGKEATHMQQANGLSASDKLVRLLYASMDVLCKTAWSCELKKLDTVRAASDIAGSKAVERFRQVCKEFALVDEGLRYSDSFYTGMHMQEQPAHSHQRSATNEVIPRTHQLNVALRRAENERVKLM